MKTTLPVATPETDDAGVLTVNVPAADVATVDFAPDGYDVVLNATVASVKPTKVTSEPTDNVGCVALLANA